MRSENSLYLHSLQLRISDMLERLQKGSLPTWKCAICFNPASWKVVQEGPQIFTQERTMIKPGKPVMYWLYHPAPKGSFVREELMVVPPHTELPPTNPG